MADVTINALQHAANWKAAMVCTVWTSSTTGYVFYVNASVDLVYKKTTDSGASWGSEVSIRAGTIDCFAVWYDKWTPGDGGTMIHLAYNDSVIDDTLYRSVDTGSADALSSEVQVFNGATYLTITGVWSDRYTAITKARGGNLYIAFNADGGTEFGVYRSTDGGVNWTARGTSNSQCIGNCGALLLPANTSDAQDIVLITAVIASSNLVAVVYDDSANSWGPTTLATLTGTSTTYYNLAASVRHSDNHLIVAAWSELDAATADLLVWDLNPSTVGGGGTTITAKTNVITDTSEYAQCCVCINQNDGTIYVGYLGGATWATDAHVYHKSSTDGGTTWSAQSAAHDETLDDQRVVWCDLGGTTTRFSPIWQNDDLDDLLCNVASSIAITPPAGILPSVNDSVSIAEAITIGLALLPAAVDLVAIAESVALTLSAGGALAIAVTDAVALAESVTLGLSLRPALFDAVTVAESTALALPIPPSVSDAVAIAESIALAMPLPVSAFDVVTVVEVTVAFMPTIKPSAVDVVSVTEATVLTFGTVIVVNLADTVTVADVVTALFPFLVPSASDLVTITEAVTGLLPFLRMAAFDLVAVAEAATSLLPFLVPVAAETVSIIEAITARLPFLVPAAFDAVAVTEVAVAFMPLLKPSAADVVTVSESTVLTFGNVIIISLSDAVTVSEAVTGLLPFLVASAADVVSVAETITARVPFLVPAAADTVTVVEVVIGRLPFLAIAVTDAVATAEVVIAAPGQLVIAAFDAVAVSEFGRVTVGLQVLGPTTPVIRGSGWGSITGSAWDAIRA